MLGLVVLRKLRLEVLRTRVRVMKARVVLGLGLGRLELTGGYSYLERGSSSELPNIGALTVLQTKGWNEA